MPCRTDDLTPKIIVDYLRTNQGLIQRQTYPNPGEPTLDESIFYNKDDWRFECFAYPECNSTCNHEDSCWIWDGEVDEDDWREEYGLSLSCTVEDGKISFETDQIAI